MIHRRLSVGLRHVVLAVSLGLAAAPAMAVTGALDNAPAATLLLPYFEVDLGNANGSQTSFTVINTKASPALAKVTLWSTFGVPTFNFDVYLEGRDTQDIDLRLLFRGVLPQTGPGLTTLGSLSSTSAVFPNCTAGANTATGVSLPIPTQLSAGQIAHLAAAHTGRRSATFGNQCASRNPLDDYVARGYVTVDVVNSCSTSFPSDPGYFVSGGLGVAANTNTLSGTFKLIERDGLNRASSSPLIHLEADGVSTTTTAPGSYTFYAAYVANTASDNREPAGTVWAVRNFNFPGTFDDATEAIIWRDPAGRSPTPFSCTAMPSPFPLDQFQVVSFDETEEVKELNSDNVFPNPPQPPVLVGPFAAQRTSSLEFTPFAAGWTLLNLNSFSLGPAANYPGIRQSVVLTRSRLAGQYSPFLPASYHAGPFMQEFGPNTCNGGAQCSAFPSF